MNVHRSGVIGGNAERSRSHNRRVVLDFVRANEPAGRAEIARSCGLSIQAVSNITGALESEGLLQASGHRAAGRGKPVLQYRMNPDGAFAVGIELRPDALICAMLNLSGDRVISERLELADASPHTAIPALRDMLDKVIASSGRDRNTLLGTGIVMPGPFGVEGLSDAGASVLPGWEGIDTRLAFREALDCPVIVENDATAAAISERVAGVACDLETFCFVYFGTGLGLGVISGGHAQRGAFGNAGEIGHIITRAGGNPCACGNRGCLETYASRMAARSYLEMHGISLPDSRTLGFLLETGNPALMDWIAIAAAHLSQVIGILENLYDPETIILGGAMPDTVIDALIARLDLPGGSVANRTDRKLDRVVRGSSGRLTAAIGGAAMIIHQTVTPSLTVFN